MQKSNPLRRSPRCKLLQAALLLGGFMVLGSELLAATKAACPAPRSLQGAWAQAAPPLQLLFDGERVVVRQGGALRAVTIVGRESCEVVVRDQGLLARWELSGDEHHLRVRQGKEVRDLRALPGVPAGLSLERLALPAPRQLSPERTAEVASQVLERAKRDQAVINEPAGSSKTLAVIGDNLRYLRGLVLDVGWIDIPRFGKPAAAAAILLAKHGSDLALMEAALPVVERDVKENGGSGEMLSVLTDELLLALGRKQRYGTQITEDAEGHPFVIPVEEPAKVDQYRREIGILSWADYLKLASKSLYDGAPIRLPKLDE